MSTPMLEIHGDSTDLIAMFEEHREKAQRVLRMLAKLEPEYEHGLFAVLFEMQSAWGISMSQAVSKITGAVTHILDGQVQALVGVIPRSPAGGPMTFAGTNPLGLAIAATLNAPRKPFEIPLIILAPKGAAIGCVVFRPL